MRRPSGRLHRLLLTTHREKHRFKGAPDLGVDTVESVGSSLLRSPNSCATTLFTYGRPSMGYATNTGCDRLGRLAPALSVGDPSFVAPSRASLLPTPNTPTSRPLRPRTASVPQAALEQFGTDTPRRLIHKGNSELSREPPRHESETQFLGKRQGSSCTRRELGAEGRCGCTGRDPRSSNDSRGQRREVALFTCVGLRETCAARWAQVDAGAHGPVISQTAELEGLRRDNAELRSGERDF